MESPDWQTQFPSHKERSKYAFDNSLFFDVEFSVLDCCDGNKVTIRSNKYVLAVTSPVFAAMFYGKLAETKPTIDLPDCTKEGLQEMLRYAHCEEANLTGNNVMEVLYLAKKYMMPFLVEKCKMYLVNEVGPEDVFTVLPEVQEMGDDELQEHFWRIVDNKTYKCIYSEPFQDISHEMLYEVLQRDTLRVNELQLFQAVDKWATKKIQEEARLVCNGKTKRAILGVEVIRLIRFPLMTENEFAEVVLPCNILNLNEVTELVQIFNKISKSPHLFIAKRRFSLGEAYTPSIRFNTIYSDGWYYDGSSEDVINVTVNKSVDLIGVQLFGSEDCAYHVRLRIFKVNQKSEPECLSDLSCKYESEMIGDLYYGFTVFIEKPLRLQPNVKYSLSAEMQGPASYYGESGKQRVTIGDDIVVRYKSARSTRTTSGHGQFPTLVLKSVLHDEM